MTNNKPLVSIGMPVRNGERLMRQALDSIVGQTYDNLEIVISDNASTDETAEICQEYASKDSRIRCYRNAVNIGVYANFRRVLSLASGDLFMWAAVDDIRPPNVVESFLEALLTNDRAVMAHGVVLVKATEQDAPIEITNEVYASDTKAVRRVRRFTDGITSQCILYGLYRRSALAKGTFPNSYAQEYLLCLQMCLLGPLEYVPTPMIIYRIRKPIPPPNPMYAEEPITLMNLLTISRMKRQKCWTVLILGCYYLMKMRGISVIQRVGATAVHVSAFCVRYRALLGKEVVFQLFAPASWLSVLVWHLARRWPFSMRVARKVQETLIKL